MPVVILQRDGTPGVTAGQFNDANQQLLTNQVAILRLLVSKGVITEEEYLRAHARATAEVDQVYAEHRESVIRQMAGLPPAESDGQDGGGPGTDGPGNDISESDANGDSDDNGG